MNQRKRDILFHIENEVQFDSLRLLLEYIRDKTKISFDIMVPGYNEEKVDSFNIGNKKIHDMGAEKIVRAGFKIIRNEWGKKLPKKISDTNYKIYITAYMYREHYDNINTNYRIMFPYAPYYFNKPQWTIERFQTDDYMSDALISHSIGTAPMTDVFAKTYVVPMLKYLNFKKKKINKNEKPTLLFVPTYNNLDFSINFLDCIYEIKKKYRVAIRGHHRSIYIDDNIPIINKLYHEADVIFDMENYTIKDAFENTDVVVSDNSATFLEAIYCEIPVALFSSDLNELHYKKINTIQYNLAKDGDILWTNNPSELINVVNKTLTKEMIYKQKRLSKKMFPQKNSTNPIGDWIAVIHNYLNNNFPNDYSLTKEYWVERINSLYDNVIKMECEATRMEQELNRIKIELNNARSELESHLSVKRSTKLLAGNIKRKIQKITGKN